MSAVPERTADCISETGNRTGPERKIHMIIIKYLKDVNYPPLNLMV